MIIGIGTDMVKISRIEKAGGNHAGFLDRVFTKKEQEYCTRQKLPAQHYAARFASKEAVLKAFGTGLSAGMKWTDIEVLHGEGGWAVVNITGVAKDLADLKGVMQIMLSYSHDEGYAVAHAVLIGGARFGATEVHHEA